MDRVVYGLIAVGGALAVVLNRRFGDASIASSRIFYGRDIPEGSRLYRFTQYYSRILTIVVGSVLMVGGVLGVFGIHWTR